MVAYIKIIYIPIVKLLLRFWWFLLFGVIYIAFIKGILEESSLNGKMGSTDNGHHCIDCVYREMPRLLTDIY